MDCAVEFDPSKSAANFRKHRIAFSDAEAVLYDPRGITIDDESEGEFRWVTVGLDSLGRVLVVSYTIRNDIPRMISARRASPSEVRQYYDQTI